MTKSERDKAVLVWLACECPSCESDDWEEMHQCKLYPAYTEALPTPDPK